MQFSYVLQLTLAVLSLNLLTGLAGQINLGQAAFVGLGAYTVVILNSTYSLTVLSASVVAIVVTGVVGLIVGLPSLRLRGLYVTLTSLGLAIIFPVIIQAAREHTGGTAGMALATPVTAPAWTGFDDTQWVYSVSFVVTVICCVLVRNLKNSRMGRALQASRDHETVGQAFGIRPATIKLTTIAISSALAGVSGCLFAMQRQFVSPGDFTLVRAIDYFVGMALGGSASILGAVFGGGFLEFAPRWISDAGLAPVLSPLLYAVILWLVVIFLPGGASGACRALIDRATNLVVAQFAASGPRTRSGTGTSENSAAVAEQEPAETEEFDSDGDKARSS
ncbi:branched-chain amino acid ABC transporter permease [Nocardia sp. CA-290969]|uniref:branched-chain amino acid ABC transporter permease n=1 Tax=Nocardia sp. CA-290969 TaxID=3239986 RepID=UPI003D9225C2